MATEVTDDDVPRTLLLIVAGADRRGVTAALTEALSAHPVEILDIEQVVIRGHLTLGVLLGPADGEFGATVVLDSAAATARRICAELGMELDVVMGATENSRRRGGRLLVTVLGSPLRPAALSAVTKCISAEGANIDRIVRTAAYPVTAVELTVGGAEQSVLRTRLAQVAVAEGVDVAVQPAELRGRGTHLVVMDVDSTLIQDEVIELIAAHAGRLSEVQTITQAAMRGELDFAESLHARVAQLAGLPASVLDDVRASVRLTPGARTLCRTLTRLGYRIAVVSGGFSCVVEPLAAELGIHHVRANVLEISDGVLTGRVVGEVIDRAAKARALREFAALEGIPLSRTVAIGDGANDLDMLAVAGLGVAFNAKPVVRAQADTGLTTPYLDSVLYLLGITREEVEQADLDAGSPTPAPPVRQP